jgi:hypothetical protein
MAKKEVSVESIKAELDGRIRRLQHAAVNAVKLTDRNKAEAQRITLAVFRAEVFG